VTAHALALQAKVVARGSPGQEAHMPPQSLEPLAHAVTTQALALHPKLVARASIGHAVHAPPQSWWPA